MIELFDRELRLMKVTKSTWLVACNQQGMRYGFRELPIAEMALLYRLCYIICHGMLLG